MKKDNEKNNLTLEHLINQYKDDSDNVKNTDLISLLAINELLNLDKLKTISRVKSEQIQPLTKLYLFAETFQTDFAKSLADNILQLQISILGFGRKELVQLVQNRTEVISPDVEKYSSKEVFR